MLAVAGLGRQPLAVLFVGVLLFLERTVGTVHHQVCRCLLVASLTHLVVGADNEGVGLGTVTEGIISLKCHHIGVAEVAIQVVAPVNQHQISLGGVAWNEVLPIVIGSHVDHRHDVGWLNAGGVTLVAVEIALKVITDEEGLGDNRAGEGVHLAQADQSVNLFIGQCGGDCLGLLEGIAHSAQFVLVRTEEGDTLATLDQYQQHQHGGSEDRPCHP